jgi:23S rRNA pseudouridine1911/1915/1917 synthase
MEILYEDENYLVLNKPSGLMVHYDGKGREETLVDWVLEKYPKLKKVGEKMLVGKGEEIYRAGIVHRLDKETSGAIALAKNQKSYVHLKNQFKERTIKKIYKVFVYGIVKDDKGVIDREIGRSPKFGLWSAQRGMKGKIRKANTEYKVLERGKESTFLQLSPKTGRTHQLRVHMKAINHPVVCDKLYASKKECLLGFKRLALHAESLEFELLDGSLVKVEAPLPDDFNIALEKIKNKN